MLLELFVGRDPKFEVRDGVFHVAGRWLSFAIPLARVRRLNNAVRAMLDAHDRWQETVVVPFHGACPRHPQFRVEMHD